MGCMLVDDDYTVARFGNDIGFMELRACGAKRALQCCGRRFCDGRCGVGARQVETFKRGLKRFGQAGAEARGRTPRRRWRPGISGRRTVRL